MIDTKVPETHDGLSLDEPAKPVEVMDTATTVTEAPEAPALSYRASLYPREVPLPDEFVTGIRAIETALGMPVWLLVHGSQEPTDLDEVIVRLFRQGRRDLPRESGVALLIDSPGGQAQSAYQLGTLLRHQCGHYVALVPNYAKSAATLLALGAKSIIVGEFGELGPLDAQIPDPEREETTSALDEVASLERMTAVSLAMVDQLMIFLLMRTDKRIDSLLPHITRFVADTLRPLYEKIDTVHYTRTSRVLKVAEEYAVRLMLPYHSVQTAQKIASHLIEHYPAHDFVIDRDEARLNNLPFIEPDQAVAEAFDTLLPFLWDGMTAIGKVEEMQP